MTLSEETPLPQLKSSGASPSDPARRRPAAGHRATRFSGGRGVTYAVLIVAVLVTLAPFAWMLLGSLKTQGELLRDPSGWLPQSPTLGNYQTWFGELGIGQYFFNSLLVAVATVAGNLLFCSMTGYALAKMDFPGKRVLFTMVMVTLMVPGVVTFVPLFVMVSNLGLVNTYPALILPFLASPLGVFLMRQFISGIPDSLIESARMDGAGDIRIFTRIILPLSGPPLATLAILTFLASWNNFLWPLVAAQSNEKYTLPVALSLFSQGQSATNYGLLLAGSVLVITPIVVLFIALQRFFIQSIASTGIK